jgi:hypothetical protein
VDKYYVVVSDETTTYHDTMSKSDWDKWLGAMNVEMQYMYDNQDWRLVVTPKIPKWLEVSEISS